MPFIVVSNLKISIELEPKHLDSNFLNSIVVLKSTSEN